MPTNMSSTLKLVRNLPTGLPLVMGLALPLGCSAAPAGQATGGTKEPDRSIVTVSSKADEKTESSLADLVERVSPTVVNITTEHRRAAHGGSPLDFFFPGERSERRRRRRPRTAAGTGFIIDNAGFVITNAHVVEDAGRVKVRLKDDRVFQADVVGRDGKSDLALLRIRGAKDLPSVKLGSSKVVRVGESVVAVGNPFGLGHTVTLGIVSAKARSIGAGPYDDFIQTDASINPGNSGGPLFNLRGEVIGINTAIRAGADGIGFAIPVDALRDVVGQLKAKGFVERGKLGLAFQAVTPEIASALGLDRPRGALVSEVEPAGAADRAGLRSGDLIVAINGAIIRRAEELPRHVARHPPGSTIEVKLRRFGKEQTVKAKLGRLGGPGAPPPGRKKTTKPASGQRMLGIDVEDASDGGVRIVGLSKDHRGLAKGDRIVEANGMPVKTVDDLRKAMKQEPQRDAVLLKVKRGRRERYVGVPLGQ